MTISTRKISKKIVQHIVNDLESMASLGDFESIFKSNYAKEVMKSWVGTVEKIIVRGSSDEPCVAFFDGSAKPNPGEMKIGGYIKGLDGNIIHRFSRDMGEGTNNEAEYISLLYLLDLTIAEGIQNVDIFGDSKLVINQVNKEWKAKDERMKVLRDAALTKLEKIPKWKLTHVLRGKNKEADILTQ